jgi:phospholipid/cholesterol/gamma-HCH transport system substrate-binding protein
MMGRLMASTRSIEVKVGLLILTAVVLLAVFILVMGGINFQPTYDVSVGFDNPGGLQSGAPVKIAGVKVGKVTAIEFYGGRKDEAAGALVRAKVQIEEKYQKSVHDNAVFYITTQGVLGEQFLAIDPGSDDRPTLPDGAVIRGLDPPRLDRLIAESYDLLHTAVVALREHEPELKDAFQGLSKTLKGTGTFFENNQERMDRMAVNVEKITEEGVKTMEAARTKYVENPAIDRIIINLDQLAATSARDVPVLLKQGKDTLGGAQKIVNTFARDDELARLKRILGDVETTTKTMKLAANDAKVISGHIRKGRGSVGALVMDEQLFDDLQELMRDLKHNPWKFFWKE